VTVLKAEVFAEARTAPLKHAHELKYIAVNPDTARRVNEFFWTMPWKDMLIAPMSIMSEMGSEVSYSANVPKAIK
jgi:hypothetical protein